MTLSVSITFPASTPPPAPRVIGWRGRHMVTEGGRPTAWVGAPAIIPAYTDGSVIMTPAIQRMSQDLMAHFCPGYDYDRWKVMHGTYLAMCNGTGFGDPLVDSGEELPKYDKCRTFQGSFITGVTGYSAMVAVQNTLRVLASPRTLLKSARQSLTTAINADNLITCIPGVDGIDATKPMPSTAEIIAKHWYSIAVNTGNPPFHWRPNWGGVIAFPFILRATMKFESRFFSPWDSEVYPNPIATYV